MNKKRIRKAVGAIIFQDDNYLLVHKIKRMNGKNGVESIPAIWDFPKGGVEDKDADLKEALLRELKEETGSEAYRVIRRFNEKISFEFPEKFKYFGQETTMFYVEYIGDKSDLNSNDHEIDDIKFFSKDEVINTIQLVETKEFLRKIEW